MKLPAIRVAQAIVLLSSLSFLCAQKPQSASPVATVPRLVRISDTFHPTNALPVAPVESVTFSIYKEQEGGAPLWQEIQNVALDADHHYTVMIGSTLNEGMPLDLFNSGEPRWLGVRFNRPGEVEQPRVQMVSVPYALKASDAETLGGLPATAYLRAPGTAVDSAGTAVAGTSGVVGASAATAATKDVAGQKPKVTSGTTNCIAAFTDATDLGCSPMWQLNGNIGLGTHTPASALDLQNGTTGGYVNFLNMKSNYTGSGVGAAGVTLSHQYSSMLMRAYSPGAPGLLQNSIGWFALNGSNKLLIGHAGTSIGNDLGFFANNSWANPQLVLTHAGNVGIGNTTPAYNLDVAGQIHAQASESSNFVIGGSNSSTSGFSVGVGGQTFSNDGAGVEGLASLAGAAGVLGSNTATSGGAPGVKGITTSPNGPAVAGVNNATTGGGGAGVGGFTNQAGNYGVAGYNNASSGYTIGVAGFASSPNGTGVQGINTIISSSGYAVGVSGSIAGSNGAGVQGSASAAGAVGVGGTNNATSGYAIGVQGNTASNSGAGVQGNSSQAGTFGVYGFNSATSGYAVGVSGGTASTSGAAVQGYSGVPGVFGVAGLNGATTGYAIGTEGSSSSPNGVGVWGVTMNCSNGSCLLVPGTAGQFQAASTGVILQGLAGTPGGSPGTSTQVFRVDGGGNGLYAGNLQVGGNLNVSGTISKAGGSFRIDHPLDPENKYLYHSFVESPDMKNIYDGVVTLDGKGEAVVMLPDWFEALNQDFRYQLTCVGGYAPVYIASEVAGNQFRIAGGRTGLKVSWQVTGIRHDAYANAHRIPLEQDKNATTPQQ